MVFVTILSRRLKARVKVYVTMYQILTCLPFVLDFIFPYPINVIISALGVLNISITRSQVVSCSNPSYDFIAMLVVETLYPIAVVMLLLIVQHLHIFILQIRSSPPSHHTLMRTSSVYLKIVLFFLYFILPSATTKIFQTFRCVLVFFLLLLLSHDLNSELQAATTWIRTILFLVQISI
jgi:hypothetical protein